MTDFSREGFLVPDEGGRSFRVMGNQIFYKLYGADTQGRLSIVEFKLFAGQAGPPLHTDGHDEIFYVLDGELTFQLDEGVIKAPKGSLVFAPQGVMHTFENREDGPAKALVMFTPGGFEDYFQEIAPLAQSGPPDPSVIGPIAARYGTNYIGMPLWRQPSP